MTAPARPPAMPTAGHLFYRCSLDLSLFSFLPPNLRDYLADRHQTLPHARSTVTQIYNTRSEIWVTSSSPEIWQPQNVKFRRDFAQLRDLITNVSGTQQDIVNRKMALQTTDT